MSKKQCLHCQKWEDEGYYWADEFCQECWEDHCANEYWKWWDSVAMAYQASTSASQKPADEPDR